MEHGNLSINSENIFPIIKKWLYSDTDIFVRELVSNGTDAVTKLKKLESMGECTLDDTDFFVKVTTDKANKKIYIEDNGIGLTDEEVKKYINEIAFSGATDFINKYDLSNADNKDDSGIIGHFGLGFYSSFMVASSVEIDSLSYKEDAQPVKWVCDGGTEYDLSEGTKATRGTVITLNIAEDSLEFLDSYKLRAILDKYCSFMPIPIYFEEIKEAKEGEEATEPKEPEQINDTHPLWIKNPNECTDEEYIQFYHKVFSDFNDPLFWIHLNMDYPFNLKGILYFPKLKHELESIEGQVKLYHNQVFVAENIKEVIPDFLLLLKGMIDCPDLPLNVSRSFLQNDDFVKKLSDYIIKKVGDKLNSIFKTDRETYNKNWDDINQFIKYGCIREQKFYEKVKKSLVFKTINDEYLTIEEYLDLNKEKTDNKIFYVSNLQQQAQYIKLFKDSGIDAVILDTNLDNPYMSMLEQFNTGVKFARIDSDISNTFKNEDDTTDYTELETLFKDALQVDNLTIKVESLKADNISAMILLSEESRRMQEMSAMFAGMNLSPDMFKPEETLVLNSNNKLVQKLLQNSETSDNTQMICKHIYDLAMLSHQPLSVDAMSEFLERSNHILELLV